MFKIFKIKRNKQLNKEKKKSRIVASDFIKKDNFWNNIFDNPYVLTGNFTVIGIDDQKYNVRAFINDRRVLHIKVYKNNVELPDIGAYGNFDRDSRTDFFVERVENKNSQYKSFGWGTILIDCMMKTLNKYCELNGCTLTRIFGTIGVGGGDTPEMSIPLYLSFDNYLFDESRKLHLQRQGFNLIDRNLEYLIV